MQLIDWPICPHYSRAFFKSRLVALENEIKALGLSVEISTDFDHYQDISNAMPDTKYVNPAFDPALNTLTPDRCFWINVYLQQPDNCVSYISAKLLPYTSLRESLENLRFWYEQGKIPDGTTIRELSVDREKTVRGKLSYSGRLYTRPDWRRKGLSRILPHLTRSLILSRFDVDYHFGVMNHILHEKGQNRHYGFAHLEKWLHLDFRYRQDVPVDLRLYVLYMSRHNIIEEIRAAGSPPVSDLTEAAIPRVPEFVF
ncbi:hypothetical protein O4H49_16630 [Kiloniella laminariae]|uniref:N-acetyltransferase domain-containing protein n=1 Tax=Kiloniella laminariae TaxID=454162 RepID=A0ABT4LMQ7_9PROT|nr:hypothetical protein [Kiloniella laminariae]MCZ4282415.1 hypothetical protein [Kiloniella laminariae]